MKDGRLQKRPDGSYELILTEGGIEVGVPIYPENEFVGERILKSWREGTYRLLTE
jgi:hypothetical protein